MAPEFASLRGPEVSTRKVVDGEHRRCLSIREYVLHALPADYCGIKRFRGFSVCADDSVPTERVIVECHSFTFPSSICPARVVVAIQW